MRTFHLTAALCGLALARANAPDVANAPEINDQLSKRLLNATELNACQQISSLQKKSIRSQVSILPLTLDNEHYMISSTQASACVYTPHSPEDIAGALKIIAKQRVGFAVSCSGHASNPGFSSTSGVHISMHGFQDVTVAADKSYVDIGGGISWADVYKKLDSSTVHVVGGRVPGPGVGGFITGGGGYSWLTNQYGLTGDTLISASLVLPNGTLAKASETVNSDLFWAIKGGGNQFGVIYSFRLKAFPRPAQVYGGLKIYAGSIQQSFLDAIAEFSANNKDPKAQIIPTTNTLAGVPLSILLAYYDGIPDYDPFPMFNVTFKPQSFSSFVQSLGASELTSNQRGGFNTVPVQAFTPAVLTQIKNQTEFWGRKALLQTGTFISYDIEPFLPYSQFAKDAAWRHTDDGLPMNLYFAWLNPLEDDFWRKALLESSAMIADAARQDGQDVDSLYLYPNYALKENPSERLYPAENLARLRQLKQKYDPQQVMSLTTFFDF